MFGIGPWELLIVFAIVLLLFGGKRLPGIATGLGSAIRNFKSSLKDPETADVQQAKALPRDSHAAVVDNKSSESVNS